MLIETNALKNLYESLQQYKTSLIPAFDPNNPIVKLHEPTFGIDEIFAANKVMLSTNVTMGKKVKQFENNYASQFDCKYGVMSNSGSSANLLAIAALANPQTKNHLKAGDEVIVSALSWSTTVWPLIQHNLIPSFVDCSLNDLNIDLNKLEEAITPKTRAIMPVHVYGNPCNMDDLLTIANKYNLIIIEDCCEAMGATYNNKSVGSFGEIGTFSFYFSHHITTLEGGICISNNYELDDMMRILRAHGWSRESAEHEKFSNKYSDIDPRFIFVNLGYNLRPTELQAAFGEVQLPKLTDFVNTRRDVAQYYKNSLEKYSDFFLFQQETPNSQHSWFGFSIIVKENAPFSVKDITKFLQKNGIETRPIIAGNLTRHPALDHYAYKSYKTLHNSDYVMNNGFAIGNHQSIGVEARKYVSNMFDAFFAQLNKPKASIAEESLANEVYVYE